jgi:hypothetical protein
MLTLLLEELDRKRLTPSAGRAPRLPTARAVLIKRMAASELVKDEPVDE